MAELHKRECVSCGAPIQIGATKCQYCGMVYEPDYWAGTVKYVPIHKGRRRLVARAEIPGELTREMQSNPEGMARFVRGEIIDQLAAGLAEVASIKISQGFPDLMRDVVIVQGEVWVEEPDRRTAWME